MSTPEKHPEVPAVEQRPVYETPWWDFYYDDLTRIDGTKGNYAWIRSHSGNGAVMSIPVTPSGKFLLIKLYRHPVKRYLWEFPAGLIEDVESPEGAGQREMIEETGVRPTSVKLIGSQIPVSGLIGDVFYSVLLGIPEVTVKDVSLQGEEGIVESKLVSNREIVEMINTQEIEDGVTLMCLARYWSYTGLSNPADK